MAVLDVTGLLAVIAVASASMLRFTDLGVLPAGVRADVARDPITRTRVDAVLGTASAPVTDAVPDVAGGLSPVVSPGAAADDAEARLQASLERLMTLDRAYRFEDLGVASLASRLSVPEYRLRRVINQRLGHRNFNVYVNGYRLAEAKSRLADRAQRELPILTIALDSGFQSIGPFNRAFKADTGLTPSEFRRLALENIADSSNRPAGS